LNNLPRSHQLPVRSHAVGNQVVFEDRTRRWRRRRATIPIMLGATAAAWIATPVAVPALALADWSRSRFHTPAARVYLVALQYLLNDTVEILAAPALWIAAGFGTTLHSPASIARHEALQRWSLRTLQRRAARLVGVRLVVEGSEALEPGPVIVLSHHVHPIDAALPSYLYLVERRWHVRGVIAADLLADPGFDLIYQRTGHVFIDRADPATARTRIQHLAAGLDNRTALVIFPEGRLYRPELRDRYLTRLADTHPERAQQLRGLRYLLPPRTQGVLQLLDSAPHADIIVLAHTGLDRLPPLKQLLRRGLPPSIPIHVHIRRIPRTHIPTDPDNQIRWLDQTWNQLDNTLRSIRTQHTHAH
jgi:1-acyl-sn-glycerol-3-phosphate acyltransferase